MNFLKLGMFYPLKLVLFLTVIFIITTYQVQAAEKAGLTFPDIIKSNQDGQGASDFILNGLGIRKATVFSIRLYVAGLYLQSKNHDAESIIASTQNKRLEIKFLRKVSRVKIRRAWIDGFEANNENLNPIRDKITVFSKAMTEFKQGDILLLEFIGENTVVNINDKKVAEIYGLDFARALLKVWLGENPPNESLKKGLLGIE